MDRTKLEQWIMDTEALPELTREGLEALQLRRLNELLPRLRERGGAYRDCPERLESLCQLAQLPFTTPQMLARQPGRYLLSSQSEVSRVISGETSGTTGPAKRVFYTHEDTEHTVGFFAAGIGEMLSPGEKCFIAFPFTGPFGLGDLIARAVEQLGGVPIRGGFGGAWQELRQQLEHHRPHTYIGFPVPLLGIARIMGGDFPVKRALVSGDSCPEGVITALEESMGSRVYPHYGSRECGLGGAVTCQAFHGMHLRENHIIAEIVDEKGNVLPEGAFGELVITTVGAAAMPLLRYRTGDYTRFLPPCPCGGVTRRLDRVSRREGPISMEALDSALFRVPGLVDYDASYDGCLRIRARTLCPGLEQVLASEAARVYPEVPSLVCAQLWQPQDLPMYMGKRHILYSVGSGEE